MRLIHLNIRGAVISLNIWCYKENFAIAAPVQQRLQQKKQNFIRGVRSYEWEGPPNKIQPQYTTRGGPAGK